MDYTEALTKATNAVKEAGVPDDLRTVAFEKVLNALIASPSVQTSPAVPSSATVSSQDVCANDDPIALIAAKTNVDLEALKEVYKIEDGQLDIILAPSRLDKSISRGAGQLALLIAAGRQASKIDSCGWTSMGPIREICKEYKKFDPANFAARILRMDDVFNFTGENQGRKVRLTRAGWEQATQMIRELADS